MIKVWICDKDPKLKNFGIVWNVEACMFLRQNYRIVGNLIGTLAKAPKQTLMSGLPLLLSPEECALLVSKNAISLFKFHQPECLSEDYINKFQLYAEMNFQNQTEAFRKQREREIDEMGDKIVEGKLKKIRQSRVIDEEIEIIEEENNGEEQDMDRFKQSVIEEEVSKIPVLSRSNVLFQTFQEQPWISNENEQLESVENIHITNELKYKVFEDLWNKGFYITDGSKFGSDFLAYPGDPIMFHAKYIVICCDNTMENEIEHMSEADLVARSRLATNVKKTVLLAYQPVTSEGKIKYKAIQWTEKE